MFDKDKKFYINLIYALTGAGMLFSLIFGICYACLASAVYGCMILFFGIIASLSFGLLLTFLLSIWFELKSGDDR